jgi:hypothetical protein
MSVMRLVQDASFTNNSFEDVGVYWTQLGGANYSTARHYAGLRSMLINTLNPGTSATEFFAMDFRFVSGGLIHRFPICGNWTSSDTGWQTITIDTSAYMGQSGVLQWTIFDTVLGYQFTGFKSAGIRLGASIQFYFWRDYINLGGGVFDTRVYIDPINGGIWNPSIDFDPVQPYTKPYDKKGYHTRANDGTLYSYNIYNKGKWIVPVNWFSASQAYIINNWWANNQDLQFFFDLITYPTYAPYVRITNKEQPLMATADYTFEDLFEGTIEISQR